MKTILITGGAGFIGSHLVRLFVKKYPQYSIVNLDDLTYAGNLENLKEIENAANYTFIKGDICNNELVNKLFTDKKITDVIHLAAESHVDRSISDPLVFIKTNIIGTVTLLNAAKKHWGNNLKNNIFYHISTDEVYGSLGETGSFLESTPYDPKSPYSASKASSDHFVRAYSNTYSLSIKISNCSNNYGPNQFPEKLIPLMIKNVKNNKPLPVYGKGENVRDWLYVEDHVKAIDLIFHNGKIGETYNIGGRNERNNLYIAETICDILNRLKPGLTSYRELITFVTNRPGHDLRYAIDATKIETELGWKAQENFESGIEKTIKYYLEKYQ